MEFDKKTKIPTSLCDFQKISLMLIKKRDAYAKRKAPGEGAIRIRIILTFLTCR